MDPDEWFSLEELTQRLGALVWVEAELASLCRAWSKVESSPSVAVSFATAAGHHQWHSDTIRSILPTSPRLAAEDAVRPPTPGWERTVGRLSELQSPDATVARLRSITKVIEPWLDREIGALNALARPVSDAALQRWLKFVSIDHRDDGEIFAELLAARSSDAARFEDHLIVNELDLS